MNGLVVLLGVFVAVVIAARLAIALAERYLSARSRSDEKKGIKRRPTSIRKN